MTANEWIELAYVQQEIIERQHRAIDRRDVEIQVLKNEIDWGHSKLSRVPLTILAYEAPRSY